MKITHSKENGLYEISKPLGAVILNSDEMKALADYLKKEGF
jgi:hypothetical protein